MVFTCKCFGQIDYSSCGSEGLQLSGIAETADAVKGGEHMKAIYRRKGVMCMVSAHFCLFNSSMVLVLHSLQQMGFTLNGVP